MKSCFLILLCITICIACSEKKTEVIWNTSFYTIGTQSSPRTTDLNEDGILDVILGAGTDELADTNQGVIAIDGESGDILWDLPTAGHIFGSPVFHDITKDNIDDVIIGGRNKNLMAINGMTGEVIWKYDYVYDTIPILQLARFNFYNGSLIPDQNGNGTPEYLTMNGGNWDAVPGTEADRFPGVLMVFDTESGEIIAADVMPDGKESYMSPVVFSLTANAETHVIFGTGGETIGGHIYQAKLTDLLSQNLKSAKIIRSSEDHGFISPPALADVNVDGRPDLISISHDSKLQAFDIFNGVEIWMHDFPSMETSNGISVGYFDGDRIPDVFTMMNRGIWPNYTYSKQVMLNGKTGQLMYQDSIGCFNLTSAAVVDLQNDGVDEVIISYNDYACEVEFEEGYDSPEVISNQIVAINFQTGMMIPIDNSDGFRNIFSSPWIGDLDSDGYLDLVYCQNYNPRNIFKYAGMRVKRVSTSQKISTTIFWGEYMGKEGKGIFSVN